MKKFPFFLFLLLISCEPRVVHRWEYLTERKNFEFHLIKRVISGNQIILQDGNIVKYKGVDSPNPNEPFFKICLEANKYLLRREKVFLKFGKIRKDNKGRLLAYVFVPKRGFYLFVNTELIQFGYGKVNKKELEDSPKYLKRFIQLEKEARKNKRGIWKN